MEDERETISCMRGTVVCAGLKYEEHAGSASGRSPVTRTKPGSDLDTLHVVGDKAKVVDVCGCRHDGYSGDQEFNQ